MSEDKLRLRLRRGGLLATVFALAAMPALACGPYYGSDLLEDRQQSLHSLWAGSWDYEARRLVPPPNGLQYSRTVRGERVGYRQSERELLEEQLLGPDRLGQLRALYALPSADAVLARPNEFRLPDSAIHYAAGAVAWHAGELDAAAAQFTQAASGSASADEPWPILAQYMLGRVAAAPLLEDGWSIQEEQKSRELAEAREAFAELRARVKDGAPDPLSLGVASLGEEARILYRAGEIKPAFRLYAQQAAIGDRGGVLSLFFLTRRARTEREAFEALLDFDLGRELAVLYAYTHFSPIQSRNRREHFNAYRAVSHQADSDEETRLTRDEIVGLMLSTFESLDADELPTTDRLAALAYRQGRYEEAARFAVLSDTGLASWVEAKLALRSDEPEAAARHFSRALEQFGRTTIWDERNSLRTSRNPGCRVAAEAGLLALSRNRVQDSLELLLTAGGVYWLDAAYVAEHVLTVDELLETVNRLPRNLPALPDWPRDENDEIALERAEARDKWPFFASPSDGVFTALHHLLARRLMRDGRYAEAIDYYPWPALRDHARRYADLMTEPDREDTEAEKAERLLSAAYMARYYGLRLLAYETQPDWAAYDANYSPRLEFSLDDVMSASSGSAPDLFADREIPSSGDSFPWPQTRYSYRLTAAELASRAADHLPRDSEAFAAALCYATAWTIHRAPGMADEYTDRYLREAARFEWHANFGSRCPAGLFDGVRFNFRG